MTRAVAADQDVLRSRGDGEAVCPAEDVVVWDGRSVAPNGDADPGGTPVEDPPEQATTSAVLSRQDA